MAAKLGGIRGGKYAIGQNADINVTPFVDVMLVLLIIFMVSAPLATVAIKLDLPPAVVTPGPPPKDPTYINIQQGGRVYIVAKLTSLANLDTDLQASLAVSNPGKAPKDDTILIKADQQVRYSDFMAVVNQLQTDGYFKISLITEEVIPHA
jgi:biopolymer transport protein ExbD